MTSFKAKLLPRDSNRWSQVDSALQGLLPDHIAVWLRRPPIQDYYTAARITPQLSSPRLRLTVLGSSRITAADILSSVEVPQK